MTGEVNAYREAVLSVEVEGVLYGNVIVEAVVDTGFSGYLTLPPDMVAQLGLIYERTARGILADGRSERLRVYSAVVRWDEHER